MQNLLVEEGAVVTISSATLPKGTYVKLQPHTSVRMPSSMAPHAPVLAVDRCMHACMRSTRGQPHAPFAAGGLCDQGQILTRGKAFF